MHTKKITTESGTTILGMLAIDSDPFRNGMIRQDDRE